MSWTLNRTLSPKKKAKRQNQRLKYKECKIKYKIKCKAVKELEKGTPHKDVAALFGVLKNTLSTWRKTRRRFSKCIKVGLGPKELNQKSK